MEQTNRKLSSSVSDLTQQVYELKMKLLQHTDCDCYLIQEYIANEANRYIRDFGGDQEAAGNCASFSSPFTSLPIIFSTKANHYV
jgi:glutathione synthase/RimK-type ligase-like ATP-grasp enzyme